jgi:GNAT superfamily N-acetyltransferase
VTDSRSCDIAAGIDSSPLSPDLTVRPLTPADRPWVLPFIRDRWGAETVVCHDTVYHPADLPGFVVLRASEPLGLVTYQIEATACEIVTIDSLLPGQGIGSTLIAHVLTISAQSGCTRLWLITTNDNLTALRFYQNRGFALAAVHRGAVDRARRLKPEIPRVGDNGIPLHDEIELELNLAANPSDRIPWTYPAIHGQAER